MTTPRTTVMRPQLMPTLHVVKGSSAGHDAGTPEASSIPRTSRKMTRELGGRVVQPRDVSPLDGEGQVPAVTTLAAARRWAKANNRELYRVDLDQVLSKYIGETEKNLAAAFAEAEKRDAVLLFDEADALFGKRSNVKDSHDRYANIDVNGLLNQIEARGGLVLLKSNRRSHLDAAFTRRLRFVAATRKKPSPPRAIDAVTRPRGRKRSGG